MSQSDVSTLNPEQKRALLAKLLQEKAAAAGPRKAPLSHAQARLWFIDHMQGASPVYTISAAVRLTGPLEQDRLQRALNTIRARHESLRTRFGETDGIPEQIIDPAAPLSCELLQGPAESALAHFTGQAFDLAQGPLIRCGLLPEADGSHILALAAHHIIADYRSLQVMISEFVQLYTAPEARLPALAIQYADYALWQQGRADMLQDQISYWKDRLSGLPTLLDMPTDFTRAALQSTNGARHAFSLMPETAERITQIARTRGMTPYMVLLALFQLLHHRYSGSPDLAIGTTVSNRDRPELQGMVGYFVNTLALRSECRPDDTLDSFLDRTRQRVLEAMAHQDAPFEQVVDQLDLTRSLAHAPVFQSMFNLHEKQPSALRAGDLTLTPLPMGSDSARFDLALDMFQGETLTAVFEYNTDLFSPETIARMTTHFITLIETATKAPDTKIADIDIRTETERAAQMTLNQTDQSLPEGDLATLIEAQVQRSGDNIAVQCEDRQLSYHMLNTAANRLAHHMRGRVSAGDRVAVCLPRSEQMVMALLAVLKIGATYIPLDPKHPDARRSAILHDSEAKLLLCADSALTAPCPILNLTETDLAHAQSSNPQRNTSAADLAYVIFTSGTTGRPKGVPIQHRSLINLLTSMARTPGLSEDDTLVAVTTPAFDIAGLELFLPLLQGAKLVVADSYAVMDDQELTHLLRDSRATVMQATPTTWRLLTDSGWRAPSGFKMLCGGEALDPDLARGLLKGAGELWNMYGPTETTIWSACAQITPEDLTGAIIPLGAPIANTTLYVLDQAGLPCATGIAGELCIGGIGLSPGYLNRPDLTEKAFFPSPFGPGRLYRTGDSVKQAASGELIYLGRLDFQIKLRGFRIELAEIEATLLQDPEVDQVVVSLQSGVGEGQLIAYLRSSKTDADALPALEQRLRHDLAAKLPAYMIPAGFKLLAEFPVNTNGKVDRKALPRFDLSAVSHVSGAAPVTPTESYVARIWGPLLKLPTITRETEFFAAGGHSLLAMQMIARLPLTVPRAVPLRLLFEHPVLRNFAAALDAKAALDPTVDATQLAIPRLNQSRDTGVKSPLSYAQTRQWALMQLDPQSSTYNLPTALRLFGSLDLGRLQRALDLLIARHDVLRSAYPAATGRPVSVLHQQQVPLIVHRQEATDTDALLQDYAQPFDLSHGPLLRLSVWPEGADQNILLLVMHHIISDALSVQLVLRELIETYGALGHDTAYSPAPLPLQYADFAAWELTQNMSKDLEYWHQHLADAPPLLDLPTDITRRARQEFHGDTVRFTLLPQQADALRHLGQSQNATPFMVMLTGFAALLGRYANMPELVIGTPVAQRPHPDLEQLVGLFVNTLALRLPGTGSAGFTTALARVRESVLAGFEHQDVPFERVVDRLSPERSEAHNPVFQAMFQWKTRQNDTPALPEELQGEPVELGSVSAKVDITLAIEDSPKGFACRFEYRTDLFHRDTIDHMARAFQALITAALADPSQPIEQLPLLHAEQAAQIAIWNQTAQAVPTAPQTLHGLVRASAGRHAQAIALQDAKTSLTYADLDSRSDALAAYLQSQGIGAGARVGIALPRSCDIVVALLAVLKTGAAYVPLDPNYPPERIAGIAQDAELALILAADGTAPKGMTKGNTAILDLPALWDSLAAERPTDGGTSGADLAYLIYTSGSTGTPKGVALEHRNAVSFVHWALQTYTQAELRGVLASTSICFDLSIFEIFATLAAGGTIYLVQDLFDLPEAAFADQITLINTVPTPMTALLRLGELPSNVQTVNLAGEPLPPSLAEAVLTSGPVTRLWNLYGPSEDTTYSTASLVSTTEKITIGAPIANTTTHVLDPFGQELPPGVPGELWLAGDGVARGYWQRPDLTADRFRTNPFEPERAPRMYRTGDRVRRLGNGQLEYLGREDRQVKIRGFRIEPGEVETAALRHSGVSGAAIGVWHDAGGNARLVAWIEAPETEIEPSLKAYLAQELPAHMVPTVYVVLPMLPRLPNGKLDRNALPAPVLQESETSENSLPQGPLEQQIAAIWQRLLGRPGLGREDNFFTLGGDSIQAIQAVAQARQEGIGLSPRDLFQHPTIAALALACMDRKALPLALGPVTGDVPLGAIQRHFLNRALPAADHWNQALVLAPRTPIDPSVLQQALDALASDHDALRAQFSQEDRGWVQTYAPVQDAPKLVETSEEITPAMAALQASFDLGEGPLWGAILSGSGTEQRLGLAAHHLIVDGLSWRILIADLEAHYTALRDKGTPAQLLRSNGMGDWVQLLSQHETFATEETDWAAIDALPAYELPSDTGDLRNTEAEARFVQTTLDAALTSQLLTEVPNAYPVEVAELLTTAVALTLRDWTGQEELRLEVESHGRADLTPDLDFSRTVGWFTGLYPVHLTTHMNDSPESALPRVKDSLRRIKNDGIGYGVLRFIQGRDWPSSAVQGDAAVPVRLNYLGQTDALFDADALFQPASEDPGPLRGLENPRDAIFDISTIVSEGRLRLRWTYPGARYHAATVDTLAANCRNYLETLIQHCLTGEANGFTPADFPDMDFGQDDLDDLLLTL